MISFMIVGLAPPTHKLLSPPLLMMHKCQIIHVSHSIVVQHGNVAPVSGTTDIMNVIEEEDLNCACCWETRFIIRTLSSKPVNTSCTYIFVWVFYRHNAGH